MKNITKNVADTYKLMFEAANKPVYSAHTFDTSEEHEHHGTYHDPEKAENSVAEVGDIGHVVVKHHNGTVKAVRHSFSSALGKHAQAGMIKDAEEHAKKLKPEHLKPKEDY
jgi:hypothetical protein